MNETVSHSGAWGLALIDTGGIHWLLLVVLARWIQGLGRTGA